MELKEVQATIHVRTEGGEMNFDISGVGKGFSILELGTYLGKRVDEHVAKFSGLGEKDEEIAKLKAALADVQAKNTAAEQRRKDREKLAEMKRLQELEKASSKG